jgi:hypothetical protein
MIVGHLWDLKKQKECGDMNETAKKKSGKSEGK